MLPPRDLGEALESAEQDGFIRLRDGAVQLSAAAQDQVEVIRDSVEATYRVRFRKADVHDEG